MLDSISTPVNAHTGAVTAIAASDDEGLIFR